MNYKEFYNEKCVPELMKQLGIENRMALPRLEKIVVSSCIKDAVDDKKALERAAEEMGQITGQKPQITRAKKSIANFKLRKGVPIGCRVVLRKKMMYDFLARLVHVALPRMRDFRGIPTHGFDGNGNYTLGVVEQIIFPEISYEKIDKTRGMNVTMVTSATSDDEGRLLLKLLGMPFREN